MQGRDAGRPAGWTMAFGLAAMACSLLMGVSGCASGGGGSDPAITLITPSKGAPGRVSAATKAWEATEGDPERRSALRAAMRDILWNRSEPDVVRQRVASLLMSDRSESGMRDNATLASLLLATEPDRVVVAELARAAGEHGWTGATTGLVRRLAEPEGDRPLDSRIEAAALRQLHPGRSLEEIAYGVFLSPGVPDGEYQDEFARRARGDAWAVLAAADEDGSARWRLLGQPVPPDADADSIADVELLRTAGRELGVLASTPMEFDWLRALASDDSAANRRWRAEVAAALSGVSSEHKLGLEIRHLEPIRWASLNRPEWLSATRAELLSAAQSALQGRTFHTRRDEGRADRSRSRERLDDWSDQMTWADLLGLLVTDEAVREVAASGRLFQFVRMDYEDKRAEYGGIIAAGDDGFIATLFPPRQRDRRNDTTFVASSDMIRQSDRALVHFHQQVMALRSYKVAGPSPEDLRYAATSGRNCVVFTSVGTDTLNADYYQPGGVVIDLGELREK